MKYFQHLASLLLVGSALSFIPCTQPAHAQAAYGSYVGIGPAIGFADGVELGGVVAFRYKLLEAPLSFRAQAFLGNNFALVPTVSYDLPINWQTDAYLGAGLIFAGGDTPSPVGNKISFALQPGIDYVVPNSNTVLFGNAIIGFDALRNGGTTLSVQGGVGLRF